MASEVLFNQPTCTLQFHRCQSNNKFKTNSNTTSHLLRNKCLFQDNNSKPTTTTATATSAKSNRCIQTNADSMECKETDVSTIRQRFQKHRWKCGNNRTEETCEWLRSGVITHEIGLFKKQGIYRNEWLMENDDTFERIIGNGSTLPFSNKISEQQQFIFTNKQQDHLQHNSQQQQQQQQQQLSLPTNSDQTKINQLVFNTKIFTRNQDNIQIPENCCQYDYKFDGLTSKCDAKSFCCQNDSYVFICNYDRVEHVNCCQINDVSKKCCCHHTGFRPTNVDDQNESYLPHFVDHWRRKSIVRINVLSLLNDLQKFVRAILPILLLFNMLPLLYAVASDIDASVVRGPHPEPQPWIPVVAYLEPLPRPTKAPKCDQTFVSRIGGPQNGTFTAPLLQNPTNHSRQCLYIFLAGPGQRVEVQFTSFNLRGSPPDGSAVGEIPACGAEYMDIYAEVQSSDPADLINSPFGGRYCGPIPPRRRISLYRAVALSFFTGKNETSTDLFGGRYQFVNASLFEIGTPVTGSACSFTITPHKNKSDVFISPTYPGAYPKDMSCTYQFIGESNQRVRLEFRDFDLFFGGPHCPFDFVKVYDGPDNTSALIGTYCGQQRNLVLYSSESSLLVHFFTLQRTAHTQNRGFKGIYEFSEGFVKLDFIRENNGMHIRGSECDQKILSKKESSGLVYSPNYPYPYLPKTVCRYFVYGMQDAQHLERVRLEFQMFEIQKGEHKDKDKETNCTDGYLKIFLKGQETQDAYDKFDYELCGYDLPPAVVSDGPRLAMVFSSGELQARGFKAKYTFETEYKIPGTAAPDGSCSFTYRSTSRKKGEFNSPRYPSNYPSETNCSYMFMATPNEQVTIVFDHFKIKADNANTTGGAYGLTVCVEDWLEMYVIFRDGSERFLGRYCGLTAPGPVESPRGAVGIRILLHTDQESVASGFKARYIFEVAKSVFGDCGGNFSGQESGVIMSPNYPAKYDGPGKGLASRACNWYLSARNGYKILMHFEFFHVEGDPEGRGCPAAVLRVWTAPDTEQAPFELCGEKAAGFNWHYVSIGQSSRISFTTTDKTIGAPGFRVVWTAVQDIQPGPPSSITHHCESSFLFQCETSGFCIAEKLRCDKVKNCGPGDDSDEMHCIMEAVEEDYDALIISSLAAVSFLICLLCTVCHCRKKRRHHRQLGLHRNAHYDSTTSATGLGSSRRHLQAGGSLSGSLRGINSDIMTIPRAPLPPTSVPPDHICIGPDLMDDDDDDNQEDLFMNGDRFSSGDSV
ncbi:cubilin isoform X3 [Bradysia coprophila]|uniref:cubilin isoform X3 n=1 Tax=Bradysia coprophila TaxID=38358 RepID=UPI00187DA777|nr:cubilin isoform X3 [Bradysia coprophila]